MIEVNKMKRIVIKSIACFVLLAQPVLPFFAQTKITEDTSRTQTEEAGTYPVEIVYTTDDGRNLKKTVYITIRYPKTNTSELIGEGIDAMDVSLDPEIFEKLTDEDIIKLAKAHAWLLVDGSNIPITVANKKHINNNPNIYEVTFATANALSVTVTFSETTVPLMQQIGHNYTNFSGIKGYYWFFSSMVPIILNIIIIANLFSLYKLQREEKEVNRLLHTKGK